MAANAERLADCVARGHTGGIAVEAGSNCTNIDIQIKHLIIEVLENAFLGLQGIAATSMTMCNITLVRQCAGTEPQ